MGRSRYKIYEPTHLHFITCTVLHWIQLFTRVEVVLKNHLHLVTSSDDISSNNKKFKSHTAKEVINVPVK